MAKLTKEQEALGAVLTPMQRNVAINIVAGMSRLEAYQKAGGKGKNKVTAVSSVNRMVKLPQVKAFTDALMNKAAEEAVDVMVKNEALERLTKSARVTITDVCNFRNVQVGTDGSGDPIYQTVWTIKNSEDMDPHIAACIKSVTITKTGPKIELHDSHASIKQLADMLGWNAPKKVGIGDQDGKPLALTVDPEEVGSALGKLLDKL